MATILDKIVHTKREVVAKAQSLTPEQQLRAMLADTPSPLDFLAALSGHSEIRLIAEVKKASPSKGIIRDDFDPVRIAQTYAANGAAALSVLTDVEYFQGSLDYLKAIRSEVAIPLLRKDFILSRYQVLEARVAGADAILLIAECLPQEQLIELYQYARELGMHVLMELYDPDNLDRVLATDCPIVGVNNRDLRTFEVDLQHTVRIKNHLREKRCLVSESGINQYADVEMLHASGVQAILVGESLMRQPDIGTAVKRLLGH